MLYDHVQIMYNLVKYTVYQLGKHLSILANGGCGPTARLESSRMATRHGILTKPGPARLVGDRIEQQAELKCCSASLPPLGKLDAPLALKNFVSEQLGLHR